MKAQKDGNTGKWKIQYRFADWQGNTKKSTKRGFKTKNEAEQWLRNFLALQQADFNMLFNDFLKIYYEDMEKRLREHTMLNKKYIIESKIVPYFGNMKIDAIKPATVREWQNELMQQGYADTYLKSINNQLTCILNYAVKYYDLKSNPCTKAGSMGKSYAEEMQFWTKQEFMTFIDSVMDKKQSYAAFMTLYWTGLRIGELLALTAQDIDCEKRTLTVSKSYQRLGKKDVITPPKTPKSKRTISIPEFLVIDLKDYMWSIYGLKPEDRIFNFTKSFMESEMKRGVKKSGVKKIKIHCIRYSHTSLLIDLGFSPLEIAERLGHEKIETTLNTYGHLYPHKQVQLANKLDEEYSGCLL